MTYRLLSVAYFMIAFAGSVQANKPNFVVVIADDCTYRDLGCYGGQAYTPHIDRLATEGMRFTRCFQAAPMCSPTRHNIYTGLYPVTSGAFPNHTRVDTGTRSIVQYLKSLGYRVAQSGKSHVNPRTVFSWEKLGTGNNPVFERVDQFLTDCKGNHDPFCLLLCSNEPHAPWDKGDPSRYPIQKIKLPPYFADTRETREEMSRYLAEITYFDDQVGQALQLLEKHGFVENTLTIVLSEQGSAFPFGKWTCYDTGLQSAFVARWPGKIKANTVNPAMIEYVDILPTLVEAAGGKPKKHLQGKSLLPVMSGKKNHKQFVFGEMTTRGINQGSVHYGVRSVRSEKYKYIWNFTPEIKFECVASHSATFKSWENAAKSGDPKAIKLVARYAKRPEIELYDIQNDPYELSNIAQLPGHEKIKTELRQELDRWMLACGDKGQATELKAYAHMPGRSPKNNQPKKAKKKSR